MAKEKFDKRDLRNLELIYGRLKTPVIPVVGERTLITKERPLGTLEGTAALCGFEVGRTSRANKQALIELGPSFTSEEVPSLQCHIWETT